MSRLIPAVGYARRSSDSKEQETSIPDQKEAVEQWAAERGYKLLRWYVDDAISGDDTERRHDFLRMIADATTGGDFAAIVCWDQARFGRFDSIEAGYYIHPLRKAGVHLATVQDGVINWNDPDARIAGNSKQEGKHQQLLDHAHNVARGQLGATTAGSWVGSSPYAYRIDGARKHKRLVLGDPAHVRTVRRIFKEFVEDGRSMTDIAARLNDEGYPSPGDRPKGWRFDSVKVILQNPAYTGDYAAGKGCYGKYHTVKAGVVAKVDRRPDGKRARVRKPAEQWIVRRDHHEAIIDRPTYERAQAILKMGKTSRSPYAAADSPYILSGLLRCGLCKCMMRGMKGGSGRYRYYECALHADKARERNNHQERQLEECAGTTVREDAILRSVAAHLDKEFLALDGMALAERAERGELQPGDLPHAFAAVKRLLAPSKRAAVDRNALTKRLATLTAQIDKAVGTLVLLDAENIPAAQERVKQLREERTTLEAELRKRPPSAADVNTEAIEVLRSLYWVGYLFRAAARENGRNPDAPSDWLDVLENGAGAYMTGAARSPLLRRALRRIAGIEVHTVIEGRGTRTRHVFAGGEIRLAPVGKDDPAVTGNLNPHLPGKSRKCCR